MTICCFYSPWTQCGFGPILHSPKILVMDTKKSFTICEQSWSGRAGQADSRKHHLDPSMGKKGSTEGQSSDAEVTEGRGQCNPKGPGAYPRPACTSDPQSHSEKLIKLYLPQSQRIGLRIMGKSGMNVSILLMRKLSFIQITMFIFILSTEFYCY